MTTTDHRRALIYTRVSRDMSGEGRSPAEQEAVLRERADRLGWTVVDVVSDNSVGASAFSKGTREGWPEAISIIRSGAVDVLMTYVSSRANRKLGGYVELAEALRSSNVLWHYSDRSYDMESPEDRFVTGLDALMDERYASEISRNVKRSVAANATTGSPHGRRIYGYNQFRDEAGHSVREPDQLTAPNVREVFRLYLAGHGPRQIAKRLNADGIATHTGKGLWTDEHVRRMIRSPAYTGLRVHRGEVVGEATWVGIIDRETWTAATARLAHMAEGFPRPNKRARLLTGVARCGVCAGRMVAQVDSRGEVYRRTYSCREGAHVVRDETALDGFISAVVVARLSRPDVVEALSSTTLPPAAVEAAVAASELRGRMDMAVSQYVAGTISSGTLAAVEKQLKPLIREAEKATRVPRSLPVDVPEEGVAEWWSDTLTREQRREVVCALFSTIVIHPVGRGKRNFDPSAIEIVWAT